MSEKANELSGQLLAAISRLENLLADLRIATQTSDAQQSMVPLKQAAGETGFNPETIRLWVSRGLIKGERHGGRWFVDPQSLAERIRCRSLQAL